MCGKAMPFRQPTYFISRGCASAWGKMPALRNSLHYFVSFYFSRQQPQTQRANQEQHEPRSPQRRFGPEGNGHDLAVAIFPVLYGLAHKGAEQSRPHVSDQRAQIENVGPVGLKYFIDDRGESGRNEKRPEQRGASGHAPLYPGRDCLRHQRQQKNPDQTAEEDRAGNPNVLPEPRPSFQIALQQEKYQP